MAGRNGNRVEESDPPSLPDWRERDFGDPVLKQALLDIWERSDYAIQGGTHMAEDVKGLRAEVRAVRSELRDLRDEHEVDVSKIDRIARAVSDMSTGFTEYAAHVYTDATSQAVALRTLAAEVDKLRQALKETRDTVNVVSGPMVPDLAEITGQHSIVAVTEAIQTQLDKRDLAEAQAKLARQEALAAEAAKDSRTKAWDVLKLVIAVVVGIVLSYVAQRLGLK